MKRDPVRCRKGPGSTNFPGTAGTRKSAMTHCSGYAGQTVSRVRTAVTTGAVT